MASQPDRVQRLTYPAGYPGTVDTVKLLGRLALEGAQSPRIRTRARQLFSGLSMSDVTGRAARVWDFILDHVTFLNNPLGAQHITTPDRLDAEIDEGNAGEACASISVYAAALLGSVGVLSRFVIVGWDPRSPEKFRHVYLEIVDKAARQVLPFDAVGAMQVGPSFQLGDTLVTKGLPVERWSLDGEKLAANQLGETDWGALIRNAVQGIANTADQFGPYGQLVGGIVRTGEMVYDRATGEPVGEKVKLTGEQRAQQAADALNVVASAGSGKLAKPLKDRAKDEIGKAASEWWPWALGIGLGVLVLRRAR